MSVLNSYGNAILRSPAEGGEGGGAGGGAGAGAAAEKPMTRAEIQELIGQTANSAVTSQLKRSLGPGIADALKAVPWGEVLAPELAKLKPTEPEPKPGDQQQPSKPDPKLSALEGQFADLNKKYLASETARQAAEQKARDESALHALTSALEAAGIKTGAKDFVAKSLFYAEKKVTVDENGNALFTVRRAPFAGGAEEDVQLPLADGVKHWLGTAVGKEFMPAPGGTDPKRPGGGPPRLGAAQLGRDGLPTYDAPATTDAEKVHRANERAAALAAKYPDL